MNQYGFVAGDPLGNADPFGTILCFLGSEKTRQKLADEFMEATGTSFTLDKNGCTSSVEASLEAQDFDLVNAMAAVAQSTHTYWVGWGRADNIPYNRPGSGFSHKKNAFMVSRNDPNFTYGVVPLQPGKCDPSPNKERYTLPLIIIHELGHMYNFETNQPPNTHGFSMEFERAYQIRNNMTPRPDACHF